MERRRNKSSTFTEPLRGDDVALKEFLGDFYRNILYKKQSEMGALLKQHPDSLGQHYNMLVKEASIVSNDDFWMRYYYRCNVDTILREWEEAEETEREAAAKLEAAVSAQKQGEAEMAAKRKREEAEAAARRKKAEAEAAARRKKAEAEAAAKRKKAEAEAAARKKAEAEAAARKKKAEAEAAAVKKRQEEAAAKQKRVASASKSASSKTPPRPAPSPQQSPVSAAKSVLQNLSSMLDGTKSSSDRDSGKARLSTSSRADAPFDEPAPTVVKLPPNNKNKKSTNAKPQQPQQGLFARFKKNKVAKIPLDWVPPEELPAVKIRGIQRRELRWGLVFVVISVVVAVVSLTAMDGVCAAARPGWTVSVDESSSAEQQQQRTYSSEAPWWVPEMTGFKATVFDALCGERPQTKLDAVATDKNVRFTVSNAANSKSLLDVSGLTSVTVQQDRLVVSKKNKGGELQTIDAPWKLSPPS